MKLQKEKIIEVIKQDASLRRRYVDDAGRCCVIGGLLKAAGFDINALRKLNSCFIGADHPVLMTACGALEQGYGLTTGGAGVLQEINDSTEDDALRRTRLIACVLTWPDDDERPGGVV